MLEDFQGDSWGSIPPLRMSSLLPHDLCHGRSASCRPPTVSNSRFISQTSTASLSVSAAFCGSKKRRKSPRFGKSTPNTFCKTPYTSRSCSRKQDKAPSRQRPPCGVPPVIHAEDRTVCVSTPTAPPGASLCNCSRHTLVTNAVPGTEPLISALKEGEQVAVSEALILKYIFSGVGSPTCLHIRDFWATVDLL